MNSAKQFTAPEIFALKSHTHRATTPATEWGGKQELTFERTLVHPLQNIKVSSSLSLKFTTASMCFLFSFQRIRGCSSQTHGGGSLSSSEKKKVNKIAIVMIYGPSTPSLTFVCFGAVFWGAGEMCGEKLKMQKSARVSPIVSFDRCWNVSHSAWRHHHWVWELLPNSRLHFHLNMCIAAVSLHGKSAIDLNFKFERQTFVS